MNPTTSSSSKLSEFPREPFPFLVYMEEFLRQRDKDSEKSLIAAFTDKWTSPSADEAEESSFTGKWKLMSVAGDTPYHDEADERTVLYQKKIEDFNLWKSMSDAEKAPFLAHAKAPYLAKIAELKDFAKLEKLLAKLRKDKGVEKGKGWEMEMGKGKGLSVDADGNKFWDEDKDFEMFAFFVFCYVEEKSPLFAAAMHRNDYITTFKNLHPEDESFADSHVSPGGWWSSFPEHVGANADSRWDKMSVEKKTTYFSRAKEVLLSTNDG